VTRTFLHRSLTGALAALAVAAPAALADEPTPGGAQAPPPAQPPQPAPAAGTVSVDGAVAVTARAGTLLGRVARFRGTARRRDAHRPVVIQRFDARSARWVAVARTTVNRRGGFIARWRADRTGRLRLRAVLRARVARETRSAGGTAAGLRATVASDELGVTVYRPAFATWYGPGFFGNTTACGLKLAKATVGVAHRTLPCGTDVEILYEGRKLVVPVIDRGPFANDADWDLTQAAAQALGMEGSDTIGAVALH